MGEWLSDIMLLSSRVSLLDLEDEDISRHYCIEIKSTMHPVCYTVSTGTDFQNNAVGQTVELCVTCRHFVFLLQVEIKTCLVLGRQHRNVVAFLIKR
jgi:hypothetical protein